MRIRERYELAAELRNRYFAARRPERGEILDAFCLATGYNRKYAISVLRGRLRKARVAPWPRRRRYGGAFQAALGVLWEATGYVCAERLRPFLPDLLQLLEAHGQLHLDAETRSLVLAASVSTIERHLVPLRQRLDWQRQAVRPHSRLRREVPIRIRSWRQQGRPGYLEIDLVSHSGRWARGEWIYTLCATDLHTGWSELVPVMTKSQPEVLAGFRRVLAQLPFPLLGAHIDNGFEFLNAALIRFCRQRGIELTRGRPFHPNDNPHVEQKNGYLVRRLIGDLRLDSASQLVWLDHLYTDLLRPFNNCFQPVMQQIGQVQVGERWRRLHDTARTPLQRLLDSGAADSGKVAHLIDLYTEVSPLDLKRAIDRHLGARPAAWAVPPGRPRKVAHG